MTVRTFSSAEAAEQIGCSERWLLDQLRASRFRGRKVGRHWRLTELDVQDNLDVCSHGAPRPTAVVREKTVMAFSSLSPTSRRKLLGE